MESMKRNWGKPGLDVQEFVPQEYMAACWIVHCNMKQGHGWVDSNNNRQPDDGEYCISPNSNAYSPGSNGYYGIFVSSGRNRTVWSNVGGCNEEHKGVSIGNQGPTANAVWQNVNWAGSSSGSPIDIYYWCDEKGGHGTIISSAEWQTNPNAS